MNCLATRGLRPPARMAKASALTLSLIHIYIYKTSVCPLAKVMRTECRKRRIKHLKVKMCIRDSVYTGKETPQVGGNKSFSIIYYM